MADKASLKRLQLSQYKLDTLLDVTLAINENASVAELLKRFEKILRIELNIGKVIVFSYNNKRWDCLLASGLRSFIYENIDVEEELLCYREITNITSLKDNLAEFDIVIPVYHKNQPLAYVLVGDIDEEREGISPTIKHLNFIQTLANIIIVAIENKRLYKEAIKKEVYRKELELASRVQSILIPHEDTLPHNEHIFATAFYFPHYEIGGDYYDFIQLNENEIGFCIADVSGKGISAALLMSHFQAYLRALFTAEISLKKLIIQLNERVNASARNERYITMFIAKYNTQTRELDYITAGHLPPILYNKDDKTFEYLTKGCPGLGMISEIPTIKKGTIQIKPNSKLLCYTDGIVELNQEQGIEISTKVLEKCISNMFRIDDNINDIIDELKINKENNRFFDDISLIGFEFY